jgi:dihydrofolate reductase
MRKLLVNTFLTLDGVMQAPGGPEEDESGGFAQGGWSVNYWDDQMGEIMGEAMSTPFDLVLGRKTYDIFAAYWPNATDELGAKPLNDATKYVASRLPPRHRVGPTPLLRRHHPLRAEARRQQGLHTGVVIGTYEPAGEIVTGSFALD